MSPKDRRVTQRFEPKSGNHITYAATSAVIRDLSLEGVLSATWILFQLVRKLSSHYERGIMTSPLKELSDTQWIRKAWEFNSRKSLLSRKDG
jgi:hypothetical protein